MPVVDNDIELSPVECERRLVYASKQYARGEITLAELQNLERKYGVDYEAAAREIAARNLRSYFRSLLKGIFHRRRC